MLTSLALIFLAGLAMAALCSLLHLPPDHRHALHRNPARPLCPGTAGPVHPRHQCRPCGRWHSSSFSSRRGFRWTSATCAGWDVRQCSCPSCPPALRSWPISCLLPCWLGITRLEAAVHGRCAGCCVPGSGGAPDGPPDGGGPGYPGRRSPAHSRRSLLR